MKKSGRRSNFIISAVGAAMGLGNTVRFTGLCALHGGAFVWAYAIVLVLVGYPLLRAEVSMGAYGKIAQKQNHSQTQPKTLPPTIMLAAVCNSAFAAVFYLAITARLVSALAVLPKALPTAALALPPTPLPLQDGLADRLIQAALIAVVCAAVFIILKKGAHSLARISVPLSIGVAVVLLMRGWGNTAAMKALFVPQAEGFLRPRMWTDALSQTLLSLSLAAGVMPTFGEGLRLKGSRDNASAPSDERERTIRTSCIMIIIFNFAGGVLNAAAVFGIAYGKGISLTGMGGIGAALALYPSVLQGVFAEKVIGGIFATVFYASLILTAMTSTAALFTPIYSAILRYEGARGRAVVYFGIICCIIAQGATIIFGEWYQVADYYSCSVVAPMIAAAESISLAKHTRDARLKFICPLAFIALTAISLFLV